LLDLPLIAINQGKQQFVVVLQEVIERFRNFPILISLHRYCTYFFEDEIAFPQ